MRIKTALIIFSGFILSVFAALSLLLFHTSQLLKDEKNDLSTASESIEIAKKIKTRLLLFNRNAFLYSTGIPNPQENDLNRQADDLNDLLVSFEQRVDDSEELKALKKAHQEVTAYLNYRNDLLNSGRSPIEQFHSTDQAFNQAVKAVDQLVDVNRNQMDTLIDNLDIENTSMDRLAIGILAAGGFVLLTMLAFISMGVVTPILRLGRAIKNYSSGQSSARASSSGWVEVQNIATNFNNMADRLEERRQDQLQFIASIAHDIRNPLNSISMASEILASDADEKEKELFRVIQRQTKHLDRLVGDLVDSTRIEAGRLELNASPGLINPIINEIVTLYRGASGLHSIHVEISPEPLHCKIDSGRISQVLINLMSNAIKYSPNGGDIYIRCFRNKNSVCVAIEDQGMGVAPEDMDNIFKPFHRSKATKSTIPGIGLGLSASQKIIHAHGGTLTIKSQLNKGSTFTVSLPLEEMSEYQTSNVEPSEPLHYSQQI